MSGFVLDCSVAVAWCIADEATAETDALLDRTRDEGATVPQLWSLELGNVLLQAAKRGRLTTNDVTARLDLISALPIRIDEETASRGLRDIVTLARAEGLTTYDASYLELAMRRSLPLASRDHALVEAARRNGTRLLLG